MPSRVPRCFRPALALAVLLIGWGGGEAHAQPAFLVKDINTTHPRGVDFKFQSPLAALGTTLFYALDDGSTGLELWKLDTTTGATSLVKDICPGSCPSALFQMTAWNGLLFFLAWDGAHGIELWRSDGTAAGTLLVRDIAVGPASGLVDTRWFAVVGDTMLFAANDGIDGAELWATDGTAAGTRLVRDINPGKASSSPVFLASAGDRVLLHAYDSVHGREPWLSNGAEAGTHLVRDINPGGALSIDLSYSSFEDKTAHGLPDGSFVFGANDGSHGYELWRTDGSEPGTTRVQDINPGVSGSEPEAFAFLNGKAYFSAFSPDYGRELWATDGTVAGTAMVKDLVPGTAGSSPGRSFLAPITRLTLALGQLYFPAGGDLWKSDGTTDGTVLVSFQAPVGIGTLGDSVMFFSDQIPRNLKLFKTDGTGAGTAEIKGLGLESADCSFRPEAPRETNGRFYFYFCPQDGLELWESDGTQAGTVRIQAPTRTPSFPVPFLFGPNNLLRPLGSHLLFAADDGASARIWRTDGSSTGTQPVPAFSAGTWPDLYNVSWPGLGDSLIYSTATELLKMHGDGSTETLLSSEMRVLGSAGGLMFLWNPTPGAEAGLWKTDGTAAGTLPVKNIAQGTTLSALPPLGSLFLFLRGDGAIEELWRSDGTEAGTFLLRTNDPGNGGPLSRPAVAGGNFFFTVLGAGASGDLAYVLWKTDGTVAGTTMVKSLEGESSLEQLTPVGNRLLFRFDDGIHGVELWVSDGTEAGTHLLKDVRPGSGSPFVFPSFVVGATVQDRFYFVADDGVHGHELWITDGTEAGTRLLKDVVPGPQSSQSEGSLKAVAVGNRLFFLADDGVHGLELWVSDGTEAGTRLVKDLSPGSTTATQILELAAVGNLLVFSASDGVYGGEPWRSDGTEAGTWRIQDIAPGASSSGPRRFTATSKHVYFIADDGTMGTELWTFPLKALSPTFQDVSPNRWSWRFVEGLAAAGFTSGCGGGNYCPASPVTRAEMAVFLERGLRGPGFVPPPATGTVFTDVPAGFWAAPWIEQLAADGLTAGCGSGQYCPGALVSRAETAVFLLRAKHGPAYTPPPATGTVFTDVPTSFWAAPWIERLAAEGLTAGCTADRYCPGDAVTREQMAVFLTRTFSLPLP